MVRMPGIVENLTELYRQCINHTERMEYSVVRCDMKRKLSSPSS